VDTTTLRIRLLGGFSVEVDGAGVAERAWRLRKARSLVKLVALAPGRRVHRDVVAELLWPDRDAAAAGNNLHQALHAARRALGSPAALVLADDTLALDPAAWVDVDAFEHAAAANAEEALRLYLGELLPEDRYEEWTHARRAALLDLHVDVCVRAAGTRLAGGDPGGGVALLTGAVAEAPLHEPAVRALMAALAAAGRRQDALSQFERLRFALRAETAADPDPETRALYRRLLAADAPGAEAPDPAGLPAPLTSFVGRGRELTELSRLLRRTRLLTLTGPGGAGKTRLGVEVARARAGDLRDGARFADLGALREPEFVPQAVATALGVPIPAHRPALDALCAHVRDRELLIVLDTCEHLLDACAHLAEALLAAGPDVRLLATSREPLRCAGEIAWRVPSLAEAAVLFRERAAAMRAGGWTPEEDAVVDDICWRLDGMPLAVELAAARTGALTVEQIAARLGGSLDVLSAGSRTALTRQQTLRAAIDWSHDLLTGDERIVFRRLAVFAGAFSLEAAEAVAAGAPIDGRRVADLVGRLVDKSLVRGKDGRFRLMDTIRQFGEERLTASGEADAVARRHLAWCLEAAAARGSPLGLEDEHDDMRAALAFALRHDPRAAVELATRLWRFWMAHSWFVEGTRWLDAVLAAAPERTALRVEALLAAAGMGLRRGDTDAYLRHVGESVDVYRDLGDPAATAEALQQHAIYEEYFHSSERSEHLFEEAIAAAARLGEERVAASAVHASAITPWFRSDRPAARSRVSDALARLRALPVGPEPFLQSISLGMPVLPAGPGGALRLVWEATLFMFHRLNRDEAIVLALNNLAWVLRAEGELVAAQTALDEALERAGDVGDRPGEALTLAHLGHLARTRGDLDVAREQLQAGVAGFRALGEHRDADVLMLGLGLVHGAAGDLEAARAAFRGALERFMATEDSPAMAGTQANWAIVEEGAGELERARALFSSSAASWRAQRLKRWDAWCSLAHGDVLQALGAGEEARVPWLRTRELLGAVFDELGVAEADARLAAHEALSGCKDAPA
jgi:predicted ATPase/DNA-binding SARP family transcriptional activator